MHWLVMTWRSHPIFWRIFHLIGESTSVAILCEYLSGHLTVRRLHTLAIRVMAVSAMLKGKSFGQTCRYPEDDCGVAKDAAFTVTARIYRGGGFTRDHVYLNGLRDIIQVYKHHDISGLIVGKGSLESLPVTTDLLARGIIDQPRKAPPALALDVQQNPVLEYLLNALR